jgi:hypothetical protein
VLNVSHGLGCWLALAPVGFAAAGCPVALFARALAFAGTGERSGDSPVDGAATVRTAVPCVPAARGTRDTVGRCRTETAG